MSKNKSIASEATLALLVVVCFTIPTTMLSLGYPLPPWFKVASFVVFTAGFAFFVALKSKTPDGKAK